MKQVLYNRTGFDEFLTVVWSLSNFSITSTSWSFCSGSKLENEVHIINNTTLPSSHTEKRRPW